VDLASDGESEICTLLVVYVSFPDRMTIEIHPHGIATVLLLFIGHGGALAAIVRREARERLWAEGHVFHARAGNRPPTGR